MSPEVSTSGLPMGGEDTEGGRTHKDNLLSYLKRRASEEKQNIRLNKSSS